MCAGFLYEKGLGTAADFSEAAKWYNKSAQLGNALAMQRFSEMYWNVSGMKPDRVTVYKFAILASTSEIPDAQPNREAYEKALSSKEIDKGKKLAANWMKAHPPVGLVKR